MSVLIKIYSSQLTEFKLTTYQLWARYLEGDNITTKIGLGRVEIEIGMAIPTL